MSAYRTSAQRSPLRECTIGGVRTPAMIGVAFVPLLFALILHSVRGDFIECTRASGHCKTAKDHYTIEEIERLELESKSPSSSTHSPGLKRLVLVTHSTRIPLEQGWSSSDWDTRPQLTIDFQRFLRTPEMAQFPPREQTLKTNIALAILSAISLTIGALALRRRGMARLVANDDDNTLTITCDLTPKTSLKRIRTEHRLSLTPKPMALIQSDNDGASFVNLVQGESVTRLVEVSENSLQRARVMRELTAFLADPAASAPT